MDFGRWKKVRGFSVALNADKGCLTGLIGPGASNLTDSLTYLRLGEECSVLLFQSPGSGIWDSTSPNVPGIKSPQTNRDNIAEL